MALATGTVLLGGCASLPDPAIATHARDAVAAERTFAAFPVAGWPGDGWWRGFGDAQLDALVEAGLAGSPDVEVANARLRRASAAAQEAGAALLPRIDATGSATLGKQSLNTGMPKDFVPRGWKDSGQIAAQASLDLDLWGRNRAALAAATSEAEAAAIEARQARLVLSSAIAEAYFDLARMHAERDIRANALRVRETSAKLVSDKLASGLETRGNVRQAESEVAAARGALVAADQALAAKRNEIAAFIGAGPDRALEITAPRLADASTAGLPTDATTALVGRRPDIAAARARVEAAASRIRVARADFFPAIRLDALFGLQSLGIGNLIDSDANFGNVGPAISLPIFHGGALKGRYRQAEAGFDEAVALYDGTVVQAYREVADAVTAQSAWSRRLIDARAARSASEDAYRIARLRYDGGLSTYLDVLAVEDRLLEARLAVAAVEAGARTNDVLLIRALGVGFGEELQESPTDGRS